MLLAVLRRPNARLKQVLARPPRGLHSRYNRAFLPKSSRGGTACLAKNPEFCPSWLRSNPPLPERSAAVFCPPLAKWTGPLWASKLPLVNVPLVPGWRGLVEPSGRRNFRLKSEPLEDTSSLPAADFPQPAREAQIDSSPSANPAPTSSAAWRAVRTARLARPRCRPLQCG